MADEFSPTVFDQKLENLRLEIGEIKALLSQKLTYSEELTERRFRSAGEIIQGLSGQAGRGNRQG